MRAITRALLGIIGLATVCISATAVPLTPERASAGLAREMVPVANGCPHGWHWVPAGYAVHGKWRPAPCARN
jgi:hypothetical protein